MRTVANTVEDQSQATVDRLALASRRRDGSRGNRSKILRKRNWVAVLEECPTSMDDVPPRRFERFRAKL
jgi:hypothetical protein